MLTSITVLVCLIQSWNVIKWFTTTGWWCLCCDYELIFWHERNAELVFSVTTCPAVYKHIQVESRLIRDLITLGPKNSAWSVHQWLKMLVKPSSLVTFNLRKRHPIILSGNIFNTANLGNIINFLSVLPFAPVEACCCLFTKMNGKGDVSDSLKVPINCLWDISLHIQTRTSPNKQQAPLQIHSRTIR